MLKFEDALAQLLAAAQPLTDVETVDTAAAHGRVLAQDLVSPLDVPPLDNSAVDGYALGGLAPRWFDHDAILMQKLLDRPDPARIQLYSDAAREILGMALGELDRAGAGG